MKIYWFTVVAQIINFLILVWLLKRFLYKPILNAIDKREEKIAAELEDAAAKAAEAEKEQNEFRRKNEEFDRQKNKMKDSAASEVSRERDRLLEGAKHEAAELRRKLSGEILELRRQAKDAVAKNIKKEVFAISEKTLSDLASTSLQEQSVRTFIARLEALDDSERREVVSAFESRQEPVIVRSAIELSPDLRTEIENSVDRLIGTNGGIRFDTAPELICGVELVAGGYKLEWNISDYLNLLDQDDWEGQSDESEARNAGE
jgi:F-type H+-transporting ATPase subunit b